MEKSMEQLKKELDELEEKEFMLQMCDHWDSSDYRYDNELCEQIRNKKKEIQDYEQSKRMENNI